MPAAPETIAAIATPPGRGGVGIVRLSGPQVQSIARRVLGRLPAARRAVFRRFQGRDRETLDEGIALYFPAPHSFTGEDVLELQGHGGPVVMDMLLAEVLAMGARMARAGEFSERAFLNDKLDLAQAEAIADLIDSGSREGARAALRSLHGEFSDRVHALHELIVELRAYVEAAIDFPDEDVDFLSDAALHERLASVLEAFDLLQETVHQGCMLQEGMTVVIAGRPNAGKSSLLNALAGHDAAIVTEIPGTTRDVLKEKIQIDGMPLHVIDTAGLRESGDAVEREGMRRAYQQMDKADRVLLIVDGTAERAGRADSMLAGIPTAPPVTVVINKIDLTGDNPGLAGEGDENAPRLLLSAKTGAGLVELRAHLKQCMGFRGAEAAELTARRRHLDALRVARAHIDEGKRQFLEYQAGELMAEELRQAQRALGEITGEFTSEDLLGRIFSSFCIGK